MRILTKRRVYEEEKKMLKCEYDLDMKVFTKMEKKEVHITDISSLKDYDIKCICVCGRRRKGLNFFSNVQLGPCLKLLFLTHTA